MVDLPVIIIKSEEADEISCKNNNAADKDTWLFLWHAKQDRSQSKKLLSQHIHQHNNQPYFQRRDGIVSN